MNKFALFVLLFVTVSAHSESAVDNNSSRSIGSETRSQIERKKEITIDKTKKNISSETKEKLRSMDLSRQELQSFSVSDDVPLSSILTPLIRAEEVMIANTKWEELTYIKKGNNQIMLDACRLYSSVPAIPTAFPLAVPPIVKRIGSEGRLLVEGGSTHQFIQDKALSYIGLKYTVNGSAFIGMTTMQDISDAVGVKLDNPALPVRCFYYYARLGEEVIQNLSDSTLAVDKGVSKETLFIGDDLQDAVKRSFRKAMIKYNPYDVEQFSNREINQGCRLPTLLGIQSGFSDWQCGGLSVESKTLSASLGGVPMLGDNVYFGRKVSLNRVNAYEVAESLLVSESQGSSVSDATENAKGTTMKKGQSSSTSVGTGVDSASGSGVGSSQ
jgi:hypothetical protein